MTTQPRLVIDTDVLSAIMRSHPLATTKAQAYLSIRRQFTFSIITRYEILRGLKAKNASRQAAVFDHLCVRSDILPITEFVVVEASEIYADLHKRGELIGDADILIAATAMANGLGVVTNNKSHFERVRGLAVETWLR